MTDEDGDVSWGQLLVPVELLALHNRAVNEPSQSFHSARRRSFMVYLAVTTHLSPGVFFNF